MESKCLTPGAIYITYLTKDRLVVQVDFGNSMDLSEEEASLLEILVHNQLELALSTFWPEDKNNEQTDPKRISTKSV